MFVPILSGYHSRGYLPHLKVEGAVYFVTFRLADSLPKRVEARLEELRDDLVRRMRSHDRCLPEQRGFSVLEASKIDAILDQHSGAAWMRDRPVADLVAEAIRLFDGDRYELYAWCVMPNHVHAVLKPLGTHALGSILHTWKSYTAHRANQLLKLNGKPFWQRESFDHWIRGHRDLAYCCHYTENNPVDAGLCPRPEDWPWSSAGAERSVRPDANAGGTPALRCHRNRPAGTLAQLSPATSDGATLSCS